MDNYLSYNDIDYIWADLDPRKTGYISIDFLDSILKKRDVSDDLSQSTLDIKSTVIMESMKNFLVLSDADKITLALKDCKDAFAKTHPYMLMDKYDTKKRGKLSAAEFSELLAGLEID